jgi:hypothetical protein
MCFWIMGETATSFFLRGVVYAAFALMANALALFIAMQDFSAIVNFEVCVGGEIMGQLF